jgi:threonine/homoserine/homoserine lactone efflux protein
VPVVNPADNLDARFLAYLVVAAVLIVTPGPDMAMVTRSALRWGPRAAHLTALGTGAGSALWAAASVLGVALLLESSALAFTIFKLAGAVYLGYLGVRSLLGSFRREVPAGPAAPARREGPAPDRIAFTQGLLNNLLNPKAGVIFLTVMPQFLRPGDTPARMLWMLVAFEVLLLCWLGLYGRLVSRVGRGSAGVRVRRAVERLTGAVLIGLGVRLAFERR